LFVIRPERPSHSEEVVREVIGLDEVRTRADGAVVEDQMRVLLFVRGKAMEVLASLLHEEVGRVLRDQNRLRAVVDCLIGGTIFSLPPVGASERRETDTDREVGEG
jgi:hypothetical protein